MAVSEQKKIHHLLWRAGFGPSVATIKEYPSVKSAYDKLFKDAHNYEYLTMMTEPEVKNGAELLTMSKEKKKELFAKSRKDIMQLNIVWFDKMRDDNNALREKMTLFWHGHFATRLNFPFLAQMQNNTLRKNALGKFGDLLMDISKDPGMLQFLNNQQNKKGSPNENFAREVMELFTLGRSHYTEDDIKNAARAFTGWGFKFPGEFIFREKQHDYDAKTFLGETGNFTGEDIIAIILKQKQTARFITTKIYRYFVNEQPDNVIIEELADEFYKNDYDIEKLMRTILSADWFYEEKNIGAKIKSPIELLAGLNKLFNISFGNDKVNLYNQKVLNQVLFYPPNVAGWPGGKNWIDSSTLLYRMKLPEMIFVASELALQPKEDPSTEAGEEGAMMMDEDESMLKKLKQINAKADWSSFISLFSGKKREEIFQPLTAMLLQTDESQLDREMIESFVKAQNDEDYTRLLCIRVLSLPDFQLC